MSHGEGSDEALGTLKTLFPGLDVDILVQVYNSTEKKI